MSLFQTNQLRASQPTGDKHAAKQQIAETARLLANNMETLFNDIIPSHSEAQDNHMNMGGTR